MYELLLKGGRIYDGSGMPSYYADVGISGGKIVDIGRLLCDDAGQTVSKSLYAVRCAMLR